MSYSNPYISYLKANSNSRKSCVFIIVFLSVDGKFFHKTIQMTPEFDLFPSLHDRCNFNIKIDNSKALKYAKVNLFCLGAKIVPF